MSESERPMADYVRWTGPVAWLNRPTTDGRIIRELTIEPKGLSVIPVFTIPHRQYAVGVVVGARRGVGAAPSIIATVDLEPWVGAGMDELPCGVDIDRAVTRWPTEDTLEVTEATVVALWVYLDGALGAWPDTRLVRV